MRGKMKGLLSRMVDAISCIPSSRFGRSPGHVLARRITIAVEK
jgi:hypothetical protein